MRTIIGVAIAGAAGALARYGLGGIIANRLSGSFPWDTLIINVSGSLALGFLFVVLTERVGTSAAVRSSITIGFIGAYTTFSTFSLETFRLIEDGAVGIAAANMAFSLALGLVAVWLGVTVGRAV
jgi:fluoride exporter